MKIEITESHRRAYPGNPGRGNIKFTKGQVLEVGKEVPKAMADRMIECKMAKEVKESAGGVDFDVMSTDELKEKMALAGKEFKGKKNAIKFLKGE